jgi:hypothetical protein
MSASLEPHRRVSPGAALASLMVALAVAVAVPALLAPTAARATPLDFVPVGDPLESELRVLDLVSSTRLGDRLRLPRLHTRPLQRFELGSAGVGATLDDRRLAPSLRRLERDLGRDAPRAAGDSAAAGRPEPGVSPRLLRRP